MLVNQKPTGRTMTIPGGLAVGTLTGLAVTVALSALLALLVNMELIERDNTGYAIMLLLLTSSAAASAIAYRRIRRRKLPVYIMAGVAYFLSLLAVTALFFGGQFHGVYACAAMVAAGSMGAFLLSGKRNQRTNVKKRRRKNR